MAAKQQSRIKTFPVITQSGERATTEPEDRGRAIELFKRESKFTRRTSRKWLVRSLVFMLAGGMIAAAFAYQHWTNPTVVRRQVIAVLENLLPKASVSLESARLRVLGGISFDEFHLTRQDDPSRTDFIYVPRGTLSHDKEQVLNGRLAIRRIDMQQPRIHLIRTKEGKWNVAGLLPEPTPEIAIPTIALHDATISVEDNLACPDAQPLEIHHVHLVIMNDPHNPPAVSLLTFKGTGVAALAGNVQVEGTLNRISFEFNASIKMPRFSIDGSVVQRLSRFSPEIAIHARALTGTGTLEAKLRYHPDMHPAWRHKVSGQLTQGTFRHAKLPFSLEDLQASICCEDGQITLERLTARSGSAQFQLSGKAMTPDSETDILDGRLRIDHLPVSKEVIEALPPMLQELNQDFAPQGALNLAIDFSRRAGQWRQSARISPQGMSALCAKFPYRLENITGTIDCNLGPSGAQDVHTVNLVGHAGSRPISIQGTVQGDKPAAVNIRISAKDVLIEDRLCAALQPDLFRTLVRPFHPKGYVDIEAAICRAQGESRFANQFDLHFHDASIVYDIFPYPLENISGTLRIEPDRWEYRGFRGTHKGAEFISHGKPVRTPRGNRTKIEITGTNVLLDAELRAALKRPALETAWRKLDPGGRMSFEAQVDLIEGQEDPVIEVTVVPRDCTLKPEFFPYALTNLRGTVHYGQHRVQLRELSAAHGPTRMNLKQGEVLFNPDDSFDVTLVDLVANPLLPDADFVRALPPALGKACTSLRIKERLSLLLSTMKIAVPAARGAPPHIQWNGGLRVKDATLLAGVPLEEVNGLVWCSGEHRGGNMGDVEGNLQLEKASVFKQVLHELHSQIVVHANEPDSLLLTNLKAKVYGGAVGGSIRVDFAPILRYQAELNALQIQLEELSRANQMTPHAQQSGLLDARLSLTGQGTELGGLKGVGSVDVPSGKMYNLPLLLDLLKVLNLRFPDGTLFEEAHAQFTLDGPLVDINRIDLLGAAISLGGRGTVNLDSRVYDMELYAVWGRIVQLSPPLIKDVWPAVSNLLLKIKMKGKIGEKPHIEREPVPGLMEPLEKLRERIAGKPSG